MMRVWESECGLVWGGVIFESTMDRWEAEFHSRLEAIKTKHRAEGCGVFVISSEEVHSWSQTKAARKRAEYARMYGMSMCQCANCRAGRHNICQGRRPKPSNMRPLLHRVKDVEGRETVRVDRIQISDGFRAPGNDAVYQVISFGRHDNFNRVNKQPCISVETGELMFWSDDDMVVPVKLTTTIEVSQ